VAIGVAIAMFAFTALIGLRKAAVALLRDTEQAALELEGEAAERGARPGVS